ncbi:hypothetical protein HPG69_010858 [Diceros bicornis minor]|uniref:Uncharacterized protein n=1 Tax=Diceros bicornis minor TaxID=77932 RepID=A0A7J7EZU3_DICBM|nr:hypothetical protein HPG69_010858 [Diceros bicornis minor]
MELLQNVMEDVKTLKEVHRKAQELPEMKPQKLFQRIEELEKLVRDREEFLELVSRKLSLMPVAEEVTMVTWEELEQAITDGWKALQAKQMRVNINVRRFRDEHELWRCAQPLHSHEESGGGFPCRKASIEGEADDDHQVVIAVWMSSASGPKNSGAV